MSNFRKVLTGAGLFIFGTGFAAVFTYIAKIFLARLLGPADYGIFILSLTALYVLSIFSDLGIGEGLAYFIPKTRKKKNEVNSAVSTMVLFSLLTSSIVALLSLFFKTQIATFFGEPILATLMPFVSVFVILYTLPNIFIGVTRGFENPNLIFIKEFFRGFLFLLIAPIATFLYKTPETPLISYVILYTLLLTITFFYAKRYFKFEKPETKYLKKVLSFSIPVFLSVFLLNIIRWTDILMISRFLESNLVGIYSAAISTAFFVQFIYGAFSIMFLPVISKLLSENKLNQARRIYIRSCTWIVAIAAPLFSLMILFPKQIINILFGSEYILGAPLLIPLGLAAFFNAILGPNIQLLLIWGKRKETLITLFIAAIVNVSLNYVLIPEFGIMGAAMSSMVGVMLWNIGISILVYKYLKVHPINKKYLLFLFTAFLSAGIVYGVRILLIPGITTLIHLAILTTLYWILYVGVSYLLYPYKKGLIQMIEKELSTLHTKITRRFIGKLK